MSIRSPSTCSTNVFSTSAKSESPELHEPQLAPNKTLGTVDETLTIVPYPPLRPLRRRAYSIIGAGDLERRQILKHKTIEELASELVIKSRALEESQEEVQLAARIGQTLLQRNQELGFEVESRTMALQNRAEYAEQEAAVLGRKLSTAMAQIRSLELERSRTAIESEQLVQDMEEMRLRMTCMKAEVIKAQAETECQHRETLQVEEELENAKKQILEYERVQTKLRDTLASATERIQELETSERFNMELITRLEIENQSICQQNHNQERKERQLLFEHETMTSRLASQRYALREHEIRQGELEKTILTLQTEIQELQESMKEEQLHGMQLSAMNQELKDELDKHIEREEDEDMQEEDLGHLRRNSLFYELSLQLKTDMRRMSKTNNDVPVKDPSSRSSRNNSADGNEEEPQTTSNRVSSRPPSYQIQLPQSNESSTQREDILKEFFILTAAAVKTAGGGLKNDAYNILNEDLYEEAMEHGITFDGFHRWLECRLEGTLDIQTALHQHRSCENQCCAK